MAQSALLSICRIRFAFNEFSTSNLNVIYTQDISQHLLRLNLILNNLVHSIPNVIQGNTILDPDQKFDYIVSNPPFKLDFSDFRDDLDTKENNERFFAGIPI